MMQHWRTIVLFGGAEEPESGGICAGPDIASGTDVVLSGGTDASSGGPGALRGGPDGAQPIGEWLQRQGATWGKLVVGNQLEILSAAAARGDKVGRC
jgi:hypothetical protein